MRRRHLRRRDTASDACNTGRVADGVRAPMLAATTRFSGVPMQPAATRMPALFVGHGSPMNALEDNAFTRGWRAAAAALPRPRAILCVSAHWETEGSRVTTSARPETVHDFY